MSKRPTSRRKPLAQDGINKKQASDSIKKDDDDTDYILLNGAIDQSAFDGILSAVVFHRTNRKKLVLILVTYGGSANSGYRIGRFIQSMYDDVAVFIPSICKSAGTLIACSANTLIMTMFGELGPLDVQLYKRDELFERRSGLVTNFALSELKDYSFDLFEHFMYKIKVSGASISFKLASEIAAKMSSDIMGSIYANINLDAIGDDAMSVKVAKEYCERLQVRFRNIKDGAIRKLVHDYPSHDFVIDYDEASELFERVTHPDEFLFGLFKDNTHEMSVPKRNGVVARLLNPNIEDTAAPEAREVGNGIAHEGIPGANSSNESDGSQPSQKAQ